VEYLADFGDAASKIYLIRNYLINLAEVLKMYFARGSPVIPYICNQDGNVLEVERL